MDEIKRLSDALERLKCDRASVPFSDNLQAVGAALPAFAVVAMGADGAAAGEHLQVCQESAKYYINRVLKVAKEGYASRAPRVSPAARTKTAARGPPRSARCSTASACGPRPRNRAQRRRRPPRTTDLSCRRRLQAARLETPRPSS